MIHETLSQIEARIRNAEAVKPESKEELLKLLATLQQEVADLSRTHEEHAQSIAGFTAISAHEATREEKNPQLLRHSLAGLASSVQGFEQSNPRLVQIVNAICTALSNLGI
jgi:phage I-like protein